MSGTKKVKDFIVPLTKYPALYDTNTMEDAIRIIKCYLNEGKGYMYRSILVFSENGKIGNEEELIGILTIRDILNTIKSKSRYDPASIRESAVTNVSQIIRPLVDAFIQSDQDVASAINLMMSKKVNILPVFDGKKAVGVVRSVDILGYIAEIL